MQATPPNTPRLGSGGMAPETPKKRWEFGGGPVQSESPELPKEKRVGKQRKKKEAVEGTRPTLAVSQSISVGTSNNCKVSGSWMIPNCLRSWDETNPSDTPGGSPFQLMPPFRSTEMLPSPAPSILPGGVPHATGWFSSQFRNLGEVGRGNFGHVVHAQNLLDGVSYAIKILDTAMRTRREFLTRIDEAKVLARCNHVNIVRYYSCWIEDRHLYLQTEFCSGGSLQAKISKMKLAGVPWDEDSVTSLLLQVTLALAHLHDQVKVAHLDVKPENIYIHNTGDAEEVYKLGDFGHAHFLEEDKQRLVQSVDSLASRVSRENFMRTSLEEGDVRYLPLDMLNDKSHLKEADIFSLGVSLYEVCTRLPPPNGNELPWRELRETGVDQQLMLDNGFSEMLVLLVESMMALDPTRRPAALSILETQRRNLFYSSP
eukprot:gene5739-8780_t